MDIASSPSSDQEGFERTVLECALSPSTVPETSYDAIDATETDEKKRFAAHRAVSLPARAAVMRDLTQAARLWIQLERQAFRISDDRDRNTASAIEEMTEEELEASLREDLRILNLLPNPEPEKPKGVAPKRSRDK